MKSARDFTESYLELTELNEFVVVDVETTLAADGNGFRVVSIALVPVVKGSIKTGKTFLVNPQQPIDADSIRIHHITDAQVAGRLTFSSRIPAINKFLDRPGVVFVAHSASFDAGVLRSEYERAGRTMPDLPVLDTMVLPRQLGMDIAPRPSLTTLMNSFGFERTGKHSALPDAKAAARCLTELLYKAAANGYRDLRRLLADHDRGTTLTVPQLTGIRTRPEAGPDLTPEHLASHAARLPEAPNEAELDEWADAAVECAKLRCALLSGRAAWRGGTPMVQPSPPCPPASWAAAAPTAARAGRVRWMCCTRAWPARSATRAERASKPQPLAGWRRTAADGAAKPRSRRGAGRDTSAWRGTRRGSSPSR
jgi:DNA polymerase III epsilon subunit-like protein